MNCNKKLILLLLYIFIIILIFPILRNYTIANEKLKHGHLYKVKTNINNKINYKYIDTRSSISNNNQNKTVNNININNIINNSINKNYDNSLVSIIIPVYNTEDTIIDSISSILNQSYQNLEIIVINDASTDKSLQKIKSINDSRIKIYNNIENYGTYVSLNIGLKYSSGNFILIHGSDDYLTIDCISVFLNKFKNSNVNMAYSKWARGFKLQKCPEGCFMFKRQLIKSMGFFDYTRFSGDTEYINRYKLKYNNKLLFIDDTLNIASIRSKSLTHHKNTTYKSQLRLQYKLNYMMYHKKIQKTKKYYMPFLYKKNIYKKYNYNFSKPITSNKIHKNVLLNDIGQIIN